MVGVVSMESIFLKPDMKGMPDHCEVVGYPRSCGVSLFKVIPHLAHMVVANRRDTTWAQNRAGACTPAKHLLNCTAAPSNRRAVVLSCCRPGLRAVIELNPLHLSRVDLGRPERRDVGLGRPLRSGHRFHLDPDAADFLAAINAACKTAGRRAAGATVDGHGAWFRGIAAGTPRGAAQPIEQPTPEAEPGQTCEQQRIVRWHLALAGAPVNPTPGCIYFDNGRGELTAN
jgi:hypothetical protein